ncbi:MAG: AsmA family protein, partial [Gammaproteobacteria bacterium]|nr:AsmA family protein [Gammaproteobacteria bacterium]
MAKIIKYAGIVVGAIIILLIIAGILLTQLINPNEYKDKISQQVLQHTGHTLQINGNISWSFFPWLGLKVTNVAFGNLPAYGTDNMATVDEAQVRVAVIPLFFGKVSISNLVLDNLQLNLIQDRNGNGNWQMISANSNQQAATSAPTSSSSNNKYSFAVDSVNILSGDIRWRNMLSGQDIQLNDIDIQGKHIGFDTPFALTASANVNGTQPKIKAAIYLSGDFNINSDFSKFSLSNLTAKVNDLTIEGNIKGGKNINGLNYSGNVSVTEFSPKAWLQSMSMPALNTANSKALTSFAGDVSFKGSDTSITLDPIKMTLDSSNLTGSFAVENFSAPVVQFQLAVDQFNMDDYLPQTSSSANNNSNSTVQKPASALPVKSLRQLNVNGNLTVGKLTMMKLQLSNATVGVNAKNGLLSLSPIQADLYKGSTTSNIRYD